MEPFEMHVRWDVYLWYLGEKDFELRVLGDSFSTDEIQQDRPIVVYKGKTQESFTGKIGEVVVGTLDHILANVEPQRFYPNIGDKDPLELAQKFFGKHDEYIAFQVIKDK